MNDRRSGLDRRHFDEQLSVGSHGHSAMDASKRAADIGLEDHGQDNAMTVHPFSISALACEAYDQVGALLVDIVSGLYDAGHDAKAWPEVLSKLKDMVRADICAIAHHEFDSSRGRLQHTEGIDAIYVTAYADFYARDNVWLQDRNKFATPGTVWASQDLISDTRLVETEFYKFWLRPQDLFHHLFGIINVDGDRSLYIMFGRSQAKGAFWRSDLDLVERLLPTLKRALNTSAAHQRLRGIQRIALDTLDMLPIGIILLNSGAQIVTANSTARDILHDENGIYVNASGMGVRLSGGRLKLRDLITGGPSRSGERAREIQGFSIPRGPGRRSITVLLSPVEDFPQARGAEDPVYVLFVADPERAVDVDPKRLTRIYGLSRAEARVAALLATGKRLDQVAENLGLTYETVRKHLKQIFSKTATDRQADLVRTLSLGPCGLRV
ncbi:MAG: helix-turn-helix transcriptional regulator [Hyphomicrobiales bacterium]|nr:helix-turn-helix transcriptional regulator [Hyphomicrobiales bacterium]